MIDRMLEDEMYGALVRRDAAYEGLFVVGVVTTGIAGFLSSVRRVTRQAAAYLRPPFRAVSNMGPPTRASWSRTRAVAQRGRVACAARPRSGGRQRSRSASYGSSRCSASP